jgi:hypothetical protein
MKKSYVVIEEGSWPSKQGSVQVSYNSRDEEFHLYVYTHSLNSLYIKSVDQAKLLHERLGKVLKQIEAENE